MQLKFRVLPKRRELLTATLRVVVLATLGTCGVYAAILYQSTEGPENPPSADNFRPSQVVPRHPVVTGFKTVTASQVNGGVEDDELVLVVVQGKARAWPINVMTGPSREIFNDTLGGRAIAATW